MRIEPIPASNLYDYHPYTLQANADYGHLTSVQQESGTIDEPPEWLNILALASVLPVVFALGNFLLSVRGF